MIMILDKRVEYSNKNNCNLNNFVLFIAGSFVTTVIVFVYQYSFVYYFQKQNKRKCILLLMAANFLLFIIQIYIFRNIYFESNWDCGTLAEVSEGLAYHNYDINAGFSGDYFSRYPNNVWLTFFLMIIKKVNIWIGFTTPYFASVLAGIVGVNLSVFLLTIIVKELTNSRQWAGMAWMIAAGYIGLSPWNSIPYSDVFGLFFTVVILYLYIRRKHSKFPALRQCIITILSFVGYQIKPTVIIVWVAILIHTLIEIKSWKEFFRKGCQIAIILVICNLLISSATNWIVNDMGLVSDNNKRFTITHYIMMGLNEASTGGFYDKDVEYSASFDNVEERVNGNITVIKNRIMKNGLWGGIGFAIKKVVMNYNDGSFAWTKEGGFFKTISSAPNIFASVWLRYFYYAENNSVIYNIMQMIWLVLLFLDGIAGWSYLKADVKEENVVFLSLIGITLFTVLFEGRARYLILYSPYYIIAAVIGLKYLLEKIRIEKV